MFDYLIVGAGLFGAVCARELTDAGKSVLVIDKRNHIAGNTFTENVEGINIHKYGAHIFHTNNKEIWDYINRFAEFNRFINTPLAYFKGEVYSLPFNMFTFYQMWGSVSPKDAQRIIAEQRKEVTREPNNLEEQAISLVGRDIYEKLIKGYTEKQWGRSCTELPAFIIRRLPVCFTFHNEYYNTRYQGIPIGGYTNMVSRMLNGIDVMLGCDYLTEKTALNALSRKVIYTGALDAYFGFSLGRLAYRTVHFEAEVLNIPNFQGNAVVNYTDRSIPFTRIIEHKWFDPDNALKIPKTVISREYSKEWQEGDEPFYPINDAQNNALYAEYKAHATREERVIFGGRLGEY